MLLFGIGWNWDIHPVKLKLLYCLTWNKLREDSKPQACLQTVFFSMTLQKVSAELACLVRPQSQSHDVCLSERLWMGWWGMSYLTNLCGRGLSVFHIFIFSLANLGFGLKHGYILSLQQSGVGNLFFPRQESDV